MVRRKKKEDNSLRDFIEALDEINRTKGIDKEEIIVAIEQSLVSAYKKNEYKNTNPLNVHIDRTTGKIDAFYTKTVVEEVEDKDKEISLSEAQAVNKDYKLGDDFIVNVQPKSFGRIATQNAKQQITQKLKEAERNIISDTFEKKKDEIILGTIQREEYRDITKTVHGKTVTEQRRIIHIDLGRAEGIMNNQNQVKGEHYHTGMRLKVYVVDVISTTRGPQIILSRTHKGLIKRLFEEEVAEIADGIVEIKSISREAGKRTKMAVWSNDEQVDPVGTCIGPKGFRIQNVLSEIGEEKIDIIKWDENPVIYIKNALAPADVISVEILETEEDGGKNSALVVVDDSQLSLAIGKDGQNVRLAARLTGWKIDIKAKSAIEQIEEDNDFDILDDTADIISDTDGDDILTSIENDFNSDDDLNIIDADI